MCSHVLVCESDVRRPCLGQSKESGLNSTPQGKLPVLFLFKPGSTLGLTLRLPKGLRHVLVRLKLHHLQVQAKPSRDGGRELRTPLCLSVTFWLYDLQIPRIRLRIDPFSRLGAGTMLTCRIRGEQLPQKSGVLLSQSCTNRTVIAYGKLLFSKTRSASL